MKPLWIKIAKWTLAVLAAIYVLIVVLAAIFQRSLQYHPEWTGTVDARFQPWSEGGRYLGCVRDAGASKNIWFILHGNAGSATGRGYVLDILPGDDTVYVLEYPGFGLREGSPSRDTINAAAREAYELLRQRYPGSRLNVLGESLGTGPASYLASLGDPPDRVVLAVPFDNLPSLAQEQYPLLPAWLLLRDRWDNVAALKNYKGPVTIYAAEHDTIIPVRHARKLAASLPRAAYREYDGDHMDWSAMIGDIEDK